MSNNPPISDMSFASWLRLQLQQTDSSIADFSRYIGTTRTVVYRYLGKCYDKRFTRPALPSPKTMEKILQYFDIPETADFLNSTRKRGWLSNRSRKRHAKFKKRWGTEYYPPDDYEVSMKKKDEYWNKKKQKVLTTKNNNDEV